MKHGFGFGMGNSIAMNIFRSDPKPAAAPPTAPVPPEVKEYVQCLEKNNNDKELCKQYMRDS